MNKLAAITLITASALAVAPSPAYAGSKEKALIGGFIGGLIADNFSWHGIFIASTLFCLASLIGVLAAVALLRWRWHRAPKPALPAAGGGRRVAGGGRRSL